MWCERPVIGLRALPITACCPWCRWPENWLMICPNGWSIEKTIQNYIDTKRAEMGGRY